MSRESAHIRHIHAHIDHAGGTGTLARELGLPIVGLHPGDQFWIDGLAQQARMFVVKPAGPFSPSRWLADGDTVTVRHRHSGLPGVPELRLGT